MRSSPRRTTSWRSDSRELCIDVGFRGQSGTGCGFPVVGAAPESLTAGEEQAAAGVGTVLGDGPEVLLGAVAAPNVARVDLLLADGRTVPATLYDAPRAIAAQVRFFAGRFTYAGELPPRVGTLVTKYLAYGDDGKLRDAAAN